MTQPSLLDFPEPRQKPLPAVAVERIRRESNKTRVLKRLQAGPATTLELIAIGGARAVGRTHELRKEGHCIRVEDLRGGLFRYSLMGAESR